MIPGAGTFFGHQANLVNVLLLWMAVSGLLAIPWMALWSMSPDTRMWRIPLVLAIGALPPAGVIGCASPLTAAGLLFPGLAWIGLCLTFLACGLLASHPHKGILLVLVFSLPAQFFSRRAEEPRGWQAVSTRFGGVGFESSDPLREYRSARSIQEIALTAQARVLVFPEAVIPDWNPGTDLFWAPTIKQLRRQGKIVLIGARIFDTHSEHTPNVVVVRGAAPDEIFFQRVPVPLAMWIPFRKTGVPLHLAGPGTLTIDGKRAAILICYEQL
jgi:hypothetical protein